MIVTTATPVALTVLPGNPVTLQLVTGGGGGGGGGSGTVTSITASTGLLGGTITTSGTISVDFGTSATQVAAGNHTHTLAGDVQGDIGATVVHKIHGHNMASGNPADGDVWSYHNAGSEWQHKTLAQAGISAVGHTHAASDIVSGTIATARLASGTADATTYLRGDQTWQALPTANLTSISEITYTSSSTYTKPAGLAYIVVEGCGGGGGGGAGSTTAGGNGGCAGLYVTAVIPAAAITTATLTVTIGTGGGAGVAGGDSEIALGGPATTRILYMPGGRAATNDMRNLQGGVTTNGFGAGQTAANATAGRHGGYGPGGGGPGNTTAANAAGLAGGRASSHEFTGGNAQTGGGAAGGAAGGGAGTNASVTVRGFGEGAGGGGANTAGAGGAGGNGTRGSGGGGGGRGSTAGGAGGSGGDGFIRIIEVVVV